MRIAVVTWKGAEPTPRMAAKIRRLQEAGHEVEVNPEPPTEAVYIAVDEEIPDLLEPGWLGAVES